MNVLIVDDIPINLRLLHAQLEGEGHVVTDATDGVEALKALEAGSIDAVISDILMPSMDGYQLCQEIRKSERFGNVPFIAYTATYVSTADEKLCMELGADKYLRKPAPLEDLVAAIEEACAARQNAPAHPVEGSTVLKEYSERLVAKLEERSMELLASTDKLALQDAALETVAVAILITDTEGVIEWVNPAFATQTGYSQEEAIGNTPRLLKSGLHDAEFYEKFWQTIKSGQSYRGEFTNRRKDGQIYYDDLTVTPVKDVHGVITHFVGVMHDVTDHKRLQEQLLQSQKMESLGSLAGGVAHDFNNLLTGILGFAELARMKLPADSPIQADLQEISKSGERAASLTKQLLSFARKEVVNPQVVNLNELTTGLDGLLRRLLGVDIDLLIQQDSGLGKVKLDPAQFEQVIMNLAINARDAMNGSGKLVIEAHNIFIDEKQKTQHGDLEPGSYVAISVTDTGGGMSKEVQAQAFDPFFTTKEKGKGTGLGLSTCYGIVRNNGGRIWVYSEIGHGTTFRIYFPRVDEAASVKEVESVSAAPCRGETVLIVEDEDSVRTLATEVLTRIGYSVLQAPSGKEALQLVASYEGPIHLLVTDVVMPQMTGPELADTLHMVRPNIKVLLVSGYTDDAMVHQGVLKSDLSFLQKPFTGGKLAAKVREVLDQQMAA